MSSFNSLELLSQAASLVQMSEEHKNGEYTWHRHCKELVKWLNKSLAADKNNNGNRLIYRLICITVIIFAY